MYRVALALGLLATPAFAIDYAPDECEALNRVLHACIAILDPHAYTRCGVASGFLGGPAFLRLKDKYPDEWGFELNCRENEAGKRNCDKGPAWEPLHSLCQKICDRKISPREALNSYCPQQRPKP